MMASLDVIAKIQVNVQFFVVESFKYFRFYNTCEECNTRLTFIDLYPANYRYVLDFNSKYFLLFSFFNLDENECKYRPCDVFARCKNIKDSFECKCFDGYRGDGLFCEGKSNSR